jgi:indole-3-glycerol phosphate synthase
MILDTIAEATRYRVDTAKKATPFDELRHRAMLKLEGTCSAGTFPFEASLKTPDISLICEIKKASPSKGIIAEEFPYLEIAADYEAAGASAISVLTEPEFFMGSSLYMSEIRAHVKLPLLRKDFIIDEYQLYESKIIGADAVLLICALLNEDTINKYLRICHSLGLSALVEAHDEAEVKTAVSAGARIVGVNNRDLRTFEVKLDTCRRLRPLVPEGVLFVAESGIKTAEDLRLLRDIEADAALVGETLMRSPDKRVALAGLRGEAQA